MFEKLLLQHGFKKADKVFYTKRWFWPSLLDSHRVWFSLCLHFHLIFIYLRVFVTNKCYSKSYPRSYRPVKAKSANILHKTSSVAWRRDSTWLKPIRTSYQSWHGLPTYSLDTGISNAAALYMRPHKKTDSTFTIHPEWGCRAWKLMIGEYFYTGWLEYKHMTYIRE